MSIQPDEMEKKKLPSLQPPVGLIIISIIWLLRGTLTIIDGSQAIMANLEVLPNLRLLPAEYEWLTFGAYAESIINFVTVAISLAQIITVYGLIMRKSWSYKLALALPVLLVIVGTMSVGLYLSIPISPIVTVSAVDWVTLISSIVGSVILVVVIWWYVRKPHVKEYLGVQSKPEELTE